MEGFAQFDLAQLPLILAGPILRRTEPQAVSVWLALQSPAQIELQIWASNGTTIDRTQPILAGNAKTITLGQAIHVVLITAYPVGQSALQPGQLYAYEVQLTPQQVSDRLPHSPLTLLQALRSPALPEVCVSYFDHDLPTFSLPPTDLNHLRIFHGSCRKVHDWEVDALPIIDQVIAESASSPNTRPHQLFFTGDQIYGDEVADPLLWAIQHLRSRLFGWEEGLLEDLPGSNPKQLQVGKRHTLAESSAGFTASSQGDKHKTQNHLLRFSEYCTSYLFAWSDCLWQLELPSAAQVGRTGKSAKRWNQQVKHLKDTAQSQMAVRRALANVATYMIFDDHDVSDDWNLNQAWCLRVLGKPLGRQVVQNALLAYALFQAWGNTPEQFLPHTIGASLLAATERWCSGSSNDAAALALIQEAIGMPPLDPLTDLPQFQQDEDVWILKRSERSLQWHYRVCGPAHEVLVLDTRTQRGYPIDQGPNAIPHLLSPSAFKQQLRPMLQEEGEPIAASDHPLTFIVTPTNVFSLEILDHVQQCGKLRHKTYDMDIGDSWTLESTARLRLMQELFRDRQHVIVLTGDIHFGAALRVDYWHQPATTAQTFVRSHAPPDACLVQLVASAISNSEVLTEILQTKIKNLLPERIRYWVGYADDNCEVEVTPGFWRSLMQFIRTWNNPKEQRNQQFVNWGYRSQWLHRQPTQHPKWQESPDWLETSINQKPKPNLLKGVWNQRWLQEGNELIGLNNIGLVQLHWPNVPGEAPLVLYDLYWYAPWGRPHVVYSRFQTPLLP